MQPILKTSAILDVVRIILKFDSVLTKIKLEKKSSHLCVPTTLGLYISHLRFLSLVSCQNTQNGLTHSNIVQLIYQARFVTIDQFLKSPKNIFSSGYPSFEQWSTVCSPTNRICRISNIEFGDLEQNIHNNLKSFSNCSSHPN